MSETNDDRMALALRLKQSLVDMAQPLVDEAGDVADWVKAYDAKIDRAAPDVFTDSTCRVCGGITDPQGREGQITGVSVFTAHDHRTRWSIRVESTHATPGVVCRFCTANALRCLATEFDPTALKAVRRAERDALYRLTQAGES